MPGNDLVFTFASDTTGFQTGADRVAKIMSQIEADAERQRVEGERRQAAASAAALKRHEDAYDRRMALSANLSRMEEQAEQQRIASAARQAAAFERLNPNSHTNQSANMWQLGPSNSALDEHFRTGGKTPFRDVADDAAAGGSRMQQVSGMWKSNLGQMAFAVQDFAVVAGQGGANSLGRAIMAASNNIGMLGMSFGTMGMVAATGAAVLASTLLPALMATDEAMAKAAERARDYTMSLDHTAKAFAAVGNAIRAGNQVRDLLESTSPAHDRVKQAERMQRDSKEQRELKQRELKDREANIKASAEGFRDQTSGQMARGDKKTLELTSEKELLGMTPEQRIGFFANEQKMGERFEKEIERAKELREEIRALEDQERRLAEAQKKLQVESIREDGADQAAEARKIQEKEDAKRAAAVKKQQDELKNRAEQVTDQLKTPFERAKEDLAELQNLRSQGLISSETFGRGRDKIVQDFQNTLKTDDFTNKNTAATEFGSSAAFSNIQTAMRTAWSGGVQDKQLEELKQIAAKADEQVKALEKIADKQPDVQFVAGAL